MRSASRVLVHVRVRVADVAMDVHVCVEVPTTPSQQQANCQNRRHDANEELGGTRQRLGHLRAEQDQRQAKREQRARVVPRKDRAYRRAGRPADRPTG